jgi:hypothetical protein
VNVLDITAFFLVAPEIIGEKRLDDIISDAEIVLDGYIGWLLPKGAWIIFTIYVTLGMALFFPLQYLGKLDYLSEIASWLATIALIAVVVPVLLRLLLAL